MGKVEDALASQLGNIEAKYGKTLQQWTELIRASGRTKHGEILSLLKEEHGVSHGDANRLALTVRESGEGDPVDQLFEGPKQGLRPLYDKLVAEARNLAPDLELSPKKAYVSLRRKTQFALVQPTTASRLDVGLVLKGHPLTDRLEAGSSLSAMVTHRVRLTDASQIDSELLGWLAAAVKAAD